jgi:glycosyltransferase involved in cell wall biosynthesis
MRTLNVLVDDQIFRLQNAGGISRYFAELTHAFARNPDLGVDITIPLSRTTNAHLRQHQLARSTPLVGGNRRADLARRVQRKLARPLPADWRSYDLIHHSYYLPEVLDASPGAVRVVTIHDMIPESEPQWFTQGNPHAAKHAHVLGAATIICVSETTRAALLDAWGPIECPIEVIPEAAGPEFTPSGPVWESGQPYILFVGRRDAYKDFSCLLDAFMELATGSPKLSLVCVGGKPFSPAERRDFANAGITARVERHVPSDRMLASMYRGAAAFVFPSRTEGFGLPVLESLSCGTPTFLADTPIFREIAQDAATYFPPGDSLKLMAALGETLSGNSDESRSTSLVRAAEFSWTKTAKRTGRAYRTALEFAEGSHVV